MHSKGNLKHIIFVIALLFFTSQSFALAQTILYAGFPELNKLPSAVISNPIFINAPQPTAKVLTYESTELSTKNIFSHYQIHLLENQKNITRYRTREVDGKTPGFFINIGTPVIRGEGVGLGGIFMLAYEKWHEVTGESLATERYYKKYEMTSIGNVKGKLFPLAVGNKLSFDYTDLSQGKRNPNNIADEENNGKMLYQVTGHLNGYSSSKKAVPGDIYVILVSRTTREDPEVMVKQYEYYFSTKLGWYVAATYFKNNQPVAVYKLVEWE